MRLLQNNNFQKQEVTSERKLLIAVKAPLLLHRPKVRDMYPTWLIKDEQADVVREHLEIKGADYS